MHLAETQKAIATALWGNIGLNCLSTSEHWQQFLNSTDGITLLGFKREQLALYESLLRNTVTETLSALFPFCKKLLATQWPELAEEYRRAYPNRSFLLYQCAQYFPEFIQNQTDLCQQFPFLPELALYEWLEVEIENVSTTFLPGQVERIVPRNRAELAKYAPIWNPNANLRFWHYPIPEIIQALSEESPPLLLPFAEIQGLRLSQPKALLIYQDPVTNRARFFELNVLTAKLLGLCEGMSVSYLEAFHQLKQTIPDLESTPMSILVEQGISLVSQCFQQGILLGSSLHQGNGGNEP